MTEEKKTQNIQLGGWGIIAASIAMVIGIIALMILIIFLVSMGGIALIVIGIAFGLWATWDKFSGLWRKR